MIQNLASPCAHFSLKTLWIPLYLFFVIDPNFINEKAHDINIHELLGLIGTLQNITLQEKKKKLQQSLLELKMLNVDCVLLPIWPLNGKKCEKKKRIHSFVDHCKRSKHKEDVWTPLKLNQELLCKTCLECIFYLVMSSWDVIEHIAKNTIGHGG